MDEKIASISPLLAYVRTNCSRIGHTVNLRIRRHIGIGQRILDGGVNLGSAQEVVGLTIGVLQLPNLIWSVSPSLGLESSLSRMKRLI